MHTQNKNTLCACGSGDKYKHCCGHKSLTNTEPKRLQRELSLFHGKLIQAVSETFQNELLSYIKQEHEETVNKDYISMFQTGLFFWFVTYYGIPGRKDTIFDRLIQSVKGKYSTETMRYLNHWKSLKPSIFYVEKVTESYVLLNELTHNVTTKILPDQTNELVEKSIIVGTLVPFGPNRNFLMVTIKLFNYQSEDIVNVLARYPFKSDMNLYPTFLNDVLAGENIQIEWENQIHLDVANHFIDYMVEENKPDKHVMEGIQYWHNLCKAKQLQIKNAMNYAAALTYVISEKYDDHTTQVAIAEAFDITPSALSQTVRRMRM